MRIDAVVGAIARAAPRRFEVSVAGEYISISAPSGSRSDCWADWLLQDVLLVHDALIGMTNMLGQIQSFIADETTEPWPTHSGRGYKGFPEPDAWMNGAAIVGA